MWLRRVFSRNREGQFSWLKVIAMAIGTGGLSLAILAALEAPGLWERTVLAQAAWIQGQRRGSPWTWLGWKWAAAGASIFGALPLAVIVSTFLAMALRVQHLNPGQLPPLRAYVIVLLPLTAFFVSVGLVLTMLGQTACHLAVSGARALRPSKDL